MSRWRSVATVVAAVVVALSGTVAVSGIGLVQPASAASVQGEPDLGVYLPQDTVVPGEKTLVNLTVANEGDMTFGTPETRSIATIAHNVRVSAEAEGPLVVETAEQPIGSVTEDKPLPAPILMTIPEGTEPGTYEIEVELEYKHTSVYTLPNGAVNDQDRTETETVEITVDDAPRFDIESVDPNVRIGDQGSIDVTVNNTGSQLAEDVALTLESSSSKFLFGQSQADTTRVNSLEPDENTTLTYDVTVPPDASVREYELSGTVQYTDPDGIPGVHRGLSAGVSPLGKQTFEITNVDPNVRIGDQGTMDVTLRNTGSQTASDVQLVLESTSSKFLFGQSQADSSRVGAIEPGENATLTYDVTVPPDASVREYALSGTVQFTDPEGDSGAYQDLSAGVTPKAEQTFAIESVESTLRVGEEGELSGTITNTGPATADNVVVQYADQSQTVIPVMRSVAVGTLEPDEAAEFAIPLEVTSSGRPIDRSIDLAVTYRNDDGEKRAYEDLTALAAVGERRDQFDISLEDTDVPTGGDRTVQATITNQLDEPVSDINVKMFVDEPLSSSEDEGYIGSLEPGDSATVTFQLSAEDGAIEKVYPADFDVKYEDSDGTSKLSNTVTVPISVTGSDDTGLPLVGIGVALVLVLAALGGFWYRRN